jgi:hypothetical protein
MARAAEVLRKPRDLTYRGSLLFADDDLVLCLFEGPSPAAIKRATDRAGFPCERVMASVWLGTSRNHEQGGMR